MSPNTSYQLNIEREAVCKELGFMELIAGELGREREREKERVMICLGFRFCGQCKM